MGPYTPKMSQDAAKIGPRRANMAPRWHQDGPRCAQMGPDGAKMALRWAVMDPKRVQNATQIVPEIGINTKRPKGQKTSKNS